MEQKDIEQIGEVINQAVEPLHERLDQVDGRLNAIENKIDNMDDRLISVESKMVTMESKMVTKSYLDDKFADFSGEVISKLRKEDAKVNRLAEILRHKEIIDDKDIEQLAELQVFPGRVS